MKDFVECQYCHGSFANKSILKNHQKNTKYCLIAQGVLQEQELTPPIKKDIVCEYCNKTFCKKYNLERHLPRCKGKKEKELLKTQDIIREKEQIIADKNKIISRQIEHIKLLEKNYCTINK